MTFSLRSSAEQMGCKKSKHTSTNMFKFSIDSLIRFIKELRSIPNPIDIRSIYWHIYTRSRFLLFLWPDAQSLIRIFQIFILVQTMSNPTFAAICPLGLPWNLYSSESAPHCPAWPGSSSRPLGNGHTHDIRFATGNVVVILQVNGFDFGGFETTSVAGELLPFVENFWIVDPRVLRLLLLLLCEFLLCCKFHLLLQVNIIF